MEFMTCVSFGHSCFHVASTFRYDCSCLSLYVYTYMVHCIIAMSLLYYCCIIIVVLPIAIFYSKVVQFIQSMLQVIV